MTAPPVATSDSSLLRIEYRPLKALVPYAKNARTHHQVQIQKLKASLAEYGWANPMLIADGGMIAGHARLQAATEMAEQGTPIPRNPDPWMGPTVDLSHLSPAQRRAYIIQDNRSVLDGGWDDGLLRFELGELKALDFDLSLTGFGDDELAELFADRTAGNTDPDDVPEVQPDAVTKLGDVWILGSHRLVCGDSTDADTVGKALNGVKPHLMVTDPPYGVEYNADWRNKALRADGTPSDGRAVGKVANDDRVDWRDAWALFPGAVVYVWHADRHASSVQASLEAADFEIRCQIIWAKGRFAIGRGHYHWQHEPCWYAVRKNSNAHWSGDRKQTTLWEISHSKSETGHSTQKPVECMKRPIENNSSPGQAVYEPFAGSFTTGIACEMTGRVAHAIELSPNYVEVGIRRWQAFSGKEARLESDGATFAEVEARKAPPVQAAE